MFLLPNGDVLYAGSENASGQTDTLHGRVLIPDYNNPMGEFIWAPDPMDPTGARRFASSIPGGSAVMYAPGKVMKTGGGNEPTSAMETLDLSGYASGDYDPPRPGRRQRARVSPVGGDHGPVHGRLRLGHHPDRVRG